MIESVNYTTLYFFELTIYENTLRFFNSLRYQPVMDAIISGCIAAFKVSEGLALRSNQYVIHTPDPLRSE